MSDTTHPTLIVTGRSLPLRTLAGLARRLGMNVVDDAVEPVPAPSDTAPVYWAGGDGPGARPPRPGAVAVESLEHFARLTGQDLSAEEWPVALYELDGCAGLAAAGIPWERARELAAEDLRLRCGSADIERAADELAAVVRELHDLRLACVPFDRFEVLAAAAAWLPADAYRTAAGYPAKPLLLLPHDPADPHRILGFQYFGGLRDAEHLEPLAEAPEFRGAFSFGFRRGRYGARFRAMLEPGHPEGIVDELISRVLGSTLVTGRPLRHYGCTFLLPLDLRLDSELGRKAQSFDALGEALDRNSAIVRHHLALPEGDPLRPDEAPKEIQAYLYFDPRLRDYVIDCGREQPGPKPIRRWRLCIAPGEYSLRLGEAAGADDPLFDLEARITDVSLYGYFNGLYVLAVTVRPTVELPAGSSLGGEEAGWWRDLVAADAGNWRRIRSLQAEAWLRFTKVARILYPSFIEQWDEKKIDDIHLFRHGAPEPREGFGIRRDLRQLSGVPESGQYSPLVRHFLARFFGKERFRYPGPEWARLGQVADDRLFVNVAYGPAGPAPADPAAREVAERLFSLALYVDQGSDGWRALEGFAYDPGFTRQEMAQQSLDRWRGLGIVSGYTNFSNVHLGFGGFFNGVVAPSHVPHIYGRMLLLALFYKTSLQHYERRVTLATAQLEQGDDPAERFRHLRRDFIEFTNNYWFREITAQMQGQEIFRLQNLGLRLDEDYALIREEMERADQYLENLRHRRLAEQGNRIARMAALIALPALVYAALAVPRDILAWSIALGAAYGLGLLGWWRRGRSGVPPER